MGWTALHFACSEGKLDVVELLIDAGADIEAKSAVSTLSSSIAVNDHLVTYLIMFSMEVPLLA